MPVATWFCHQAFPRGTRQSAGFGGYCGHPPRGILEHAIEGRLHLVWEISLVGATVFMRP